MAGRLIELIRAAWFMAVVAASCIVLSIPVFLAMPFGQGGRALSPALIAWFRCWFWAAGIRTVIRGREHVSGLRRHAVVLMGNHQSALDIPLVALACGGRVRFLAKKSLFWIPIVGWIMKLTGFTAIDRSSARKTRPALDLTLRRIAAGRNCWVIFPEGTRSMTGELLPYHRGSFNFARQAAVPIIPFAIDGGGQIMPKGAWSPRPGTITIVIGEPIMPDEILRASPDELLGRARGFTAATLAALRTGAAGIPGAGAAPEAP